eukprot:TRINITY_DN6688_c0_g1_i1.p1 TRINITY_DN6688_c0_g1~~TRINITY_DN6688_c0_g1_i1.p1  ORF type:complete len:126 (-),score=23.92 TRINITY_DN6688_c0_g1_i1:133-510(-)
MGVFTFICRSSGDEWSAKQYSGDLEASASSSFDLQRSLVKAALACDSSGGVQSSFISLYKGFETDGRWYFQVADGGLVETKPVVHVVGIGWFQRDVSRREVVHGICLEWRETFSDTMKKLMGGWY